jgi:hypothetical protein
MPANDRHAPASNPTRRAVTALIGLLNELKKEVPLR